MDKAKLRIQSLISVISKILCTKQRLVVQYLSCIKEQIHATFKIGFIISMTKLVRLKTIQKVQQKKLNKEKKKIIQKN
jgi:hypothetical protein